MPEVTILSEHVVINDFNATSPEAVKKLILSLIPDLPLDFAVITTIMLENAPDISAGKEHEQIDSFSVWLHSLFSTDFPLMDISAVLFYNSEHNVITVLVGNLGGETQLPEGTWMPPNQKPVEV